MGNSYFINKTKYFPVCIFRYISDCRNGKTIHFIGNGKRLAVTHIADNLCRQTVNKACMNFEFKIIRLKVNAIFFDSEFVSICPVTFHQRQYIFGCIQTIFGYLSDFLNQFRFDFIAEYFRQTTIRNKIGYQTLDCIGCLTFINIRLGNIFTHIHGINNFIICINRINCRCTDTCTCNH